MTMCSWIVGPRTCRNWHLRVAKADSHLFEGHPRAHGRSSWCHHGMLIRLYICIRCACGSLSSSDCPACGPLWPAAAHDRSCRCIAVFNLFSIIVESFQSTVHSFALVARTLGRVCAALVCCRCLPLSIRSTPTSSTKFRSGKLKVVHDLLRPPRLWLRLLR